MTEKDDLAIMVQETRPLTNWKNPPSLQNLKDDYRDAKEIHNNHVIKINKYNDNMNGTGTAKVKVPKGNSSIVPLLIRKQAEWRYSALQEPFLSTEDLFNVRPVSWEDRRAAIQNELVLNNQINTKIDKVAFIDEYVRTAVDEGTVIVQVGWDFEEEDLGMQEEPVFQFVMNPAAQQQIEQLAQMQQQDPDRYSTEVPEEMKQAVQMQLESGSAVEPVMVGQRQVHKTRTIKNTPTLTIRDSRNVVIDPTCQGNIDKARFVIYSFESSLQELQAQGRYKNLDHINLNANTILGTPDHELSNDTQNFNFKDKPRQKFIVHEYWGYWDIDGSGTLKPIVAAWVGDTMIRCEENPFPDKKLPFVIVHYLPVRKSIYGEPDGALLEDNQKIVGAVTRGMIDILGKSANGQTGFHKGFLDGVNRRKYESGMDYEFNQGMDPRMAVFMHTYPEIPQSASFMLQVQNQEAESLTGVKTFSQGVTSTSLGDVAAGIRGALDAASKRELGILRRLASGITQIGRKIIQMNSEFLSEEEVIRVTNEDFVSVRRDDLGGEFDLKLQISTPEEDNNKAEQLAFMLQTVGPDEDPAIRRMILSDICRLRKMPDLAKRIESYTPEPDPMQQKRMELEIALMESQINENASRANKYHADAGLQEARANVEDAKVGLVSSERDQKDLDFLEQQSGIKQDRDLEKQGAQARAQTDMKMVQHQLDMERDGQKQSADIFKERIKSNKAKSK